MSDSEVAFVKKAMRVRLRDVRDNQDFIDIKLKIDGYRGHNKLMKEAMKERLLVLDTKYNLLDKIINIIQISIIVFSSGATFVQAADDHIPLSIEDISFISLIITSYTALILAVSKYLKFDDKKENLHKLRGQFSEFLITIQSRDDQLNTWKSDNFWAGIHIKSRISEWNTLETKLKEEFEPMIDKKQILCSEFEKELDSESKSHFSLFARRKSLYYDKKKSIMERKEQQFKNDNPVKRISWLRCGYSSKRTKSTQTVPDDDDDYDDDESVENEPTVEDVVVDDVPHVGSDENDTAEPSSKDIEDAVAVSTDNSIDKQNRLNQGV